MADERCSVCDRPYGAHSGKTCPPCGSPIEHHSPAEQEACWESAARMARCKLDAGPRELTYHRPGINGAIGLNTTRMNYEDDSGMVTFDAHALNDVDREALRRFPNPSPTSTWSAPPVDEDALRAALDA